MEDVILVEQELDVWRIDTFLIKYNKHGAEICISLNNNVNKKKKIKRGIN